MSLRLCFDFISMLCMCLNDTYRPIVCKMKGTLSSLFFAFLLLLKAKKEKIRLAEQVIGHYLLSA